MINCFMFIVILQANDITPALVLGNGMGNMQVSIFGYRKYGDMPLGPQQYEVDNNECFYINDINTGNLNNSINRILKYDSTGNFLFAITSRSVPTFDRAWFGPIAIDPKTNDLIILGSYWGDETSNVIPNRKSYIFRFSESGKHLETKEIGIIASANHLLYDYNGRFYSKFVDGGTEFDQDFVVIREIPKQITRQQGYSQWSEWITFGTAGEYTPEDASAGKFLTRLENSKTGEQLRFVFYKPPYYLASSKIEGCDRHGNLILKGIKGNFLRIHPMTRKVGFINLHSLGIPKGVGDVRHAPMISPNGYLYKAMLIRDDNEELEYHIYRISPEMFIETECDSIIYKKVEKQGLNEEIIQDYEDYEVYSTIISNIIKLFSTISDVVKLTEVITIIPQKKFKLVDKFDKPTEIILLSVNEVYSIAQGEEGWMNYREKYPRSILIGFSGIGFNSDHTYAMLYYDYRHDYLEPHGYLAILYREKDHWIIKHKVRVLSDKGIWELMYKNPIE